VNVVGFVQVPVEVKICTSVVGCEPARVNQPTPSMYSSASPARRITLCSSNGVPFWLNRTVTVTCVAASLLRAFSVLTLRVVEAPGDATMSVVAAVEMAVLVRPGVTVEPLTSTQLACTSTAIAASVTQSILSVVSVRLITPRAS
jgi:hypothetical protein